MHFETKNWLFDFGCDWLQLLRPSSWNWLTFTLFKLEFEWERYLGAVEASVVVLGFRARAAYTYDHNTEAHEELRDSMDTWLSTTSVVVKHDDYVAMKEDAEKWRSSQPAAPSTK